MNYSKIYEQLILKSKNRKLTCYTEKHHIIPRCMGGNDKIENIAILTAREHFLAHKLLVEIYPNNHKLLYSLWLMAIGKQKWKYTDPYQVSSRDYERIKLRFIESRKGTKISKSQKIKIGKANSKKVTQYDFQGNKIAEFSSAKEAEGFITNKPRAHWTQLHNNIGDCCNLKQKSAYGYIWKWGEDLLHLEDHKGSSNNFQGKQIKYKNKIYKTATEFKKQNNISSYMFIKMMNTQQIKYND